MNIFKRYKHYKHRRNNKHIAMKDVLDDICISTIALMQENGLYTYETIMYYTHGEYDEIYYTKHEKQEDAESFHMYTVYNMAHVYKMKLDKSSRVRIKNNEHLYLKRIGVNIGINM